MAEVDGSGATAHWERLYKIIQDKVSETMPQVAEELGLSALSRAPTIDQEYNMLMAEDGETAAVPRDGDRSGDTDDRIRLDKPESTYMHNAVMAPGNMEWDASNVYFGNIGFLNLCATYRYRNLRRTGKNTHEPSEWHEVGPYFEQLDAGGEKLIVPVFILGNGHKYRLRPVDDEHDPGLDSMHKAFPAHNMFNPASLESAVRATLRTALAEIGSETV